MRVWKSRDKNRLRRRYMLRSMGLEAGEYIE